MPAADTGHVCNLRGGCRVIPPTRNHPEGGPIMFYITLMRSVAVLAAMAGLLAPPRKG